jgi:hypothetical protein
VSSARRVAVVGVATWPSEVTVRARLLLIPVLLAPALVALPAYAAGPSDVDLTVDFSDAATVPGGTDLRDHGEAYGPRTGPYQGSGLTYGWVTLGGSAPLSLVGNGRNRGGPGDLRLRTLLHAQLPSGSPGVKTPGSWELAVPTGAYEVTVAVGDAGTAVDSTHWLSIEDQNAVAAFTPTSAARHRTATRTVTVTDGRLTLSPQRGTNTKLNHVTVRGLAAPAPAVLASTPANLATGVSPTATITEDLALVGGRVDDTTFAGAVTLTRVSTGVPVPARLSTSGGGDTISLSPTAPLAPDTLYRFDVTSGVRDVAGRAFQPWSSVFTTGTSGPVGGPIAFTKVASGAAAAQYTSVTVGPDGKLYAATLTGRITRWTIAADGTLSSPQPIDTVRTHATAAGWSGAPNRTVIGLAWDPASTATDLKLWITDNQSYVGSDVPDWTSAVATLSGPDLGTYQPVLVGLPRSVKDHETNSLAFHGGKLYLTQGSMNAMGATDGTWKRPEHLLSAAVLVLDPAALPATLPLDVRTEAPGSYDPAAPGAPLTIHATGVRNAYDLVWHRNGHLYVPTNGSAAGGAVPAAPVPAPAQCATRRPDGPWTGPAAPGIASNGQAETDYVFDVRPGKYYGHPNPARCEWVLNGGNPTVGADPVQVNAYPVGTLPDRNWDLDGIWNPGLHASSNGAVEYRGTAPFGGALDGALLVVRYNADQDVVVLRPDPVTGRITGQTTGLPGLTGFDDPLDIALHLPTGRLYVTELGGQRITLLRPVG